jgi:hypothetical protein
MAATSSPPTPRPPPRTRPPDAHDADPRPPNQQPRQQPSQPGQPHSWQTATNPWIHATHPIARDPVSRHPYTHGTSPETSEPQKGEPDEAGSQAQQDAAEAPEQLRKAAPIDPKKYRGRLQLDRSGRLWHGRYPLAPRLRAVSFEAARAAQVLVDPDVVVVPTVAVHGAQVPWGKVVTQGVPVVGARRLPSMLRQLPAVLGRERVAAVARQA